MHHQPRTTAARRRGTILLMVLVVIMVLSLGAYAFSEFMVLESQSAVLQGETVQARALADSGVELVAAHLGDRENLDPATLYDNPAIYRSVIVNAESGGGRFSVVAPVEQDLSAQGVRFGIIDESAKLNINSIFKLKLEDAAARKLLMGLPNMDESLADGILDWIDSDTTRREFGAEGDEYESLSPPYTTKDGPLDSLDELLLVRGVTPQLLFGEDANRNGLLDPNENDGAGNMPPDNADGQLDRGWASYLTVFSRERNIQMDGTDKIYVNNNTLSDLYDTLVEKTDIPTAVFIVAFRLKGPMADPNANNPAAGGSSGGAGATGASGGSSGRSGATTGGGGTSGGSGSSTAAAGGSTGGSSDAASTGTTGGSSDTAALKQVAAAVGTAVAAAGGSQEKVTRAGMDLTAGGTTNVTSLYDMVGVKVQVMINGVNTTLDSPWTTDPSAMNKYLPEIMNMLSTTEEKFIEGRVNINQARFETLVGLPNMTEDLAYKIVSSQQFSSGGASLAGQDSDRATTGWLLTSGLVDLPTIRKLDPYITARGDVYRVQVVGHFDRGGPSARVEAVIDATEDPPHVLFSRDLSDLGRGYPRSLLSQSQ